MIGQMRVSQEVLGVLIRSLDEYRAKGIEDPWILSDGTVVDPLDALLDLKDARAALEIYRATR